MQQDNTSKLSSTVTGVKNIHTKIELKEKSEKNDMQVVSPRSPNERDRTIPFELEQFGIVRKHTQEYRTQQRSHEGRGGHKECSPPKSLQGMYEPLGLSLQKTHFTWTILAKRSILDILTLQNRPPSVARRSGSECQSIFGTGGSAAPCFLAFVLEPSCFVLFLSARLPIFAPNVDSPCIESVFFADSISRLVVSLMCKSASTIQPNNEYSQ